MKLYDFPFAPNPRKLRVYLAEKGIEIPRVTVNIVKGEQQAPDFVAKNPMGSLPMLELDDGTCLRESLAIIEYLEELHPEPPMIGRTPLERARVRALERSADLGVLAGVARVIHATHALLPGRTQDPALAAHFRRDLEKPTKFLDAEMADGRTFVAGSNPTIADCTLFAAFEFARTVQLEVAWPERLARWYAGFRERPSAAA